LFTTRSGVWVGVNGTHHFFLASERLTREHAVQFVRAFACRDCKLAKPTHAGWRERRHTPGSQRKISDRQTNQL
jgi:hypothetical protein